MHQRVLEEVGRLWRRAALKEQPGPDQPTQPIPDLHLRARRGDCREQLVRELPSDGGTDLRQFLCRRAEPVEPGHERGVQRRRHSVRSGGNSR